MEARGKPLYFTEKEIEDLANMKFGDPRMRLVLTLLFPFIDRTDELHIDHVFPRVRFSDKALTNLGLSNQSINLYQEMKESLANLQLLTGPENLEKRSKLPGDWLDGKTFPTPERNESREEYIAKRLLNGVHKGMGGFAAFYKERRKQMKKRICQLLGY